MDKCSHALLFRGGYELFDLYSEIYPRHSSSSNSVGILGYACEWSRRTSKPDVVYVMALFILIETLRFMCYLVGAWVLIMLFLASFSDIPIPRELVWWVLGFFGVSFLRTILFAKLGSKEDDD